MANQGPVSFSAETLPFFLAHTLKVASIYCEGKNKRTKSEKELDPFPELAPRIFQSPVAWPHNSPFIWSHCCIDPGYTYSFQERLHRYPSVIFTSRLLAISPPSYVRNLPALSMSN